MRSLVVVLATMACAAALAQDGRWTNETSGTALRPGVYGRIAVEGSPPPVLNAKPMMVARATLDRRSEPLYLYVPPSQVRRWGEHCAKWDACARPVHFVRVDDSPSRLGDWKRLQRAQAQAQVEAVTGGSLVAQALNRVVGP